MKAKLINKINEGSNITSFYFKPEKSVKYLPGQFFYYTLPSLIQDDKRGATRHFTAASSPTEDFLMLTTRISDSGYKQTLGTLETGSTVELDGPSGTFIIDEDEKGNHLLLAGGIGITPFRSIIKYHTDMNLTSKITLLYSSRNKEDTVFLEEFAKLTITNKNLKIFLTLTKPPKGYKKLKGRIDAKMINDTLNEPLTDYTAWICGPPGFVNAMEDLTDELDFKDIRSEKFTGY